MSAGVEAEGRNVGTSDARIDPLVVCIEWYTDPEGWCISNPLFYTIDLNQYTGISAIFI